MLFYLFGLDYISYPALIRVTHTHTQTRMVRFSGIICPNVLQLPSFRGRRPRTEREKFELDMAKVRHMTEKLNGKPIRDSHKRSDIGRVTNNWLKGNEWWVEFEIDNPDEHRDYIEDIRNGRLGNLSLQHWWLTNEPIEVSICEDPMRPGSKIVTELCDHPGDCESNTGLYKENPADFLVSAARTIEEALVLEISDMSNPAAVGSSGKDAKDSKDTGMALSMPGEEEGEQKHHGGASSDSKGTLPSDSAQALADLGLPPPPPRPTVGGAQLPSSMGPPPARPPAHQQPQQSHQHSIPLRPHQHQQQPQHHQQPAGQSRGSPAPPPSSSSSRPQQQQQHRGDMDTNDDHTAHEETDAGPVEQDAEKRREMMDKQIISRITKDTRIESHARNALYDLMIRNTSQSNMLKQENQRLKKELEAAQAKGKDYDKVTKDRRDTIADGLGTLLGTQGADDNTRKRLEDFFRTNPAVDEMLRAGGDMLVSACRDLSRYKGQVEDMQAEADYRQALLEHVMSGGFESDFQYSGKRAGKSVDQRVMHRAKRTGGSSSSGGSGASAGLSGPPKKGASSTGGQGLGLQEVTERDDDDSHMAADPKDEKVSAGRAAPSKGERKETPGSTRGRGWAPVLADNPGDDIYSQLSALEDFSSRLEPESDVSVTVHSRSEDGPDARKRRKDGSRPSREYLE